MQDRRATDAGATVSSPLCTLSNVTQRYGQRVVLDIDRLAVKPGELLAIVGPSGSGKSTLLRLIGLLEAPSSGDVDLHINGERHNYTSAPIDVRRRVCSVLQDPRLLSRSVRANIAYGLKLRGDRNTRDRVDEILARVALTHVQHSHPTELSGGERQRVALARVLILEPQVLLLDEPTANLDPYNVRIIEELLAQQRQDHQTTVVLITHNIFQARRLADRVAFIFDGGLVEVSPTAQFFDNPRCERTVAFLSGDMVC